MLGQGMLVIIVELLLLGLDDVCLSVLFMLAVRAFGLFFLK